MAKQKTSDKQETKPTARSNGKHPGGAPRTRSPETVTEDMLRQIDELAMAQAKDTLIAETLGFDVTTFKNEFSKRCRQKRAQGKGLILRKQFEGCQSQDKGAVTERIWFGKQHLEQTDKHEVEGSMTLRVPGLTIIQPETPTPRGTDGD